MVKKFDVYMCDYRGTQKPCVVLSPDEINQALSYVVIAPITTKERAFPCRVGVKLKGKTGQVALDMIHTVSKDDLVSKLGLLPPAIHTDIIRVLHELFCAK